MTRPVAEICCECGCAFLGSDARPARPVCPDCLRDNDAQDKCETCYRANAAMRAGLPCPYRGTFRDHSDFYVPNARPHAEAVADSVQADVGQEVKR